MSTAEVFAAAPGAARGLRVAEYDVLVAAGLLDEEPVELLEGALVVMSPQQPAHAEAVRRLVRALQGRLAGGWVVSVQSPFVAGDRSEPEPDVAVVPDDDYSRRHPSSAALVVEVSRSSLVLDLGVKARLYAASGVPEYWVLDVASRALHAHRTPDAPQGGTPGGVPPCGEDQAGLRSPCRPCRRRHRRGPQRPSPACRR